MGQPFLRAAALALLEGKTPTQAAKAGGYSGPPALARATGKALGLKPTELQGLSSRRRYQFSYRAPFNLSQMLRYLGRDPDNASEQLQGGCLTRHFPVEGRQILVGLTLGGKGCEVALGRSLKPDQWLEVHGAVWRLLGLHQPLDAFYRQVRGHPVFAPLVKPLRGVRIPLVPTLWEALSWAIMGQQINLAFAYKLRNRLIRLGNGKPAEAVAESVEAAEAGNPTAPLPFPGPEAVLRVKPDQLRAHQFSRQKIAYLAIAAQACLDGPLRELSLESHTPDEAEAAMVSVKGIGRWSAAYGLMRHLGHIDALPVGDAGLRSALKEEFGLDATPDIAEQEWLMEPFRPFRGLATYYLWRARSTRTPD